MMNTQREYTYLRVMPESMMDGGRGATDRGECMAMEGMAACNLLRPFVPDGTLIGGGRVRGSRLDAFT